MRYTVVQFLLLSMLFASRVSEGGRLLFERGPAVHICGVVLIALSMGLAGLAFANLRTSFHVNPEPKAGASLVTTGIYRHLRHPMYTAVVLLTVGLFLTKPTENIAISAAALIGFYLIKARHEERKLCERYDRYEEYRARSFGVLPLWRGSVQGDGD